jgi:hypothetical protein
MSVSSPTNSTAARLARWLLDCALRHWPEETRPWGLALAAEIDETTSAFETVRWSLGGMMFFARAVLSEFPPRNHPRYFCCSRESAQSH